MPMGQPTMTKHRQPRASAGRKCISAMVFANSLRGHACDGRQHWPSFAGVCFWLGFLLLMGEDFLAQFRFLFLQLEPANWLGLLFGSGVSGKSADHMLSGRMS